MSDAKEKTPPRGRNLARIRAIQALYQWVLNPTHSVSLVQQFYESEADEQSMRHVDADYFQVLVKGCIEHKDELDGLFGQYLQIQKDLLDPIELCILRLSTYELKHRVDVPKRVVINEGVELTKEFGAEDGHKFVNGVLDKVARDLRQHES